jgi:hypothetical protein
VRTTCARILASCTALKGRLRILCNVKRQLFLLLWNRSKHHDYLDLQQYKQSMLQGGVQFREQVMQIGFSLLVLIEGHKKVLFPKSMVEKLK